jgi:predicted N-acetyltransferase YhbS
MTAHNKRGVGGAISALTYGAGTHNAARLMTALAASSTTETVISPERTRDAPLVEGLIDRAFGPGRYAKAAERLREGARPLLSLSFVAWRGGEAVGCVRLWSVRIGETPALLLGPIAVEAPWRRGGLGADLVRRVVAEATAQGAELIILVGDEPFFGPLGFSATPAQDVRMPGPVDQRRVMARALVPGAARDLKGEVTRAA